MAVTYSPLTLSSGISRSLIFLEILLWPCFSSPAVTSTTTACDELSRLLPNIVLLPGTPSYTSPVQSYFFRESRLNSKCVIAARSTHDVSEAIAFLTNHPSVHFAIKGGDHSVNRGTSNIENGITIDLGGMNSVKPHNDNWDIVEVGPGTTSVGAYRVLDVHNRTLVGGRVGSVGLAGFFTSGGLSFFSPERGFGCDTIVNMELVLVSGKVVNVNNNLHPDLFQAIKGGQNNFSVVTRFDIRTFPQGPSWGGAIQYPSSADVAQLEAFVAFKGPDNYDPFVEVEQTFIYYGGYGSFFSSNNMFYTKPVVNASGLSYFTEILPQMGSKMRISNTTDFATELNNLQPTDLFAIYATTTFTISPTILKKIRALWKDMTVGPNTGANLTSVLTFQSLPPPPPPSNPNSMGFAPVQSLLASIESSTQEEGVFSAFKYINYATSEFQKPIRSYRASHVHILREVAKRYDPTGMFQKQVPSGFKLSD